MKALLAIILLSALVLLTGCASSTDLPSTELTLPQTHFTPKNQAIILLNRLTIKANPVRRDLISLLTVLEANPDLYNDPDLKKKYGNSAGSVLDDVYEFLETLNVKFAGE